MALQLTGDRLQLWPGFSYHTGSNPFVGSVGSMVFDASGEYYAACIYAFEDMTISHVGLKMNAVSDSPTADIRIETIDASTGIPSGTLWATNTNIVTGALDTNWTVHALTAPASISKGQWVAIKVLYNSGTSFQVAACADFLDTRFNYSVLNTGTPSRNSGLAAVMSIGSSSTNMYRTGAPLLPYVSGGAANVTNSNGARHGNRFQVPFACEIHGIVGWAPGQDCDLAIYDDAGSPISGASGSFDASVSAGKAVVVFSTPFVPALNTWYRMAVIPTTGSNTAIRAFGAPSTDLLSAALGEGKFRRTDYTTSGGWSDANEAGVSFMDLIIRRLDDGVSAGGGKQKVY